MKKILVLLVAIMMSFGAYAKDTKKDSKKDGKETSEKKHGKVNLNTASQAELETVTGIGPAKAKAIIDYRKKNGKFKKVEELDEVPGFGKATVDKVKSELTVK